MPEVLYEVRDRVAWITLNRPERLNAVNREMRRRLSEIFRDMDQDDDVRVAVLRGAGDRAFSSGFDLKEGPIPAPGQQGVVGQGGESPALTILKVGKPLIAAIHGYCLAGSLDLALACDIRIAADNALLGAPEVHWNLSDGFTVALLTRIVGLGHALDLLLRGQNIDAAHALRIGLVTEVVSPDQLLSRAEALARQIAAQAPLAIRAMKELTYHSVHDNLEQVLALQAKLMRLLVASEDGQEASRAFRERRDPAFRGR